MINKQLEIIAIIKQPKKLRFRLKTFLRTLKVQNLMNIFSLHKYMSFVNIVLIFIKTKSANVYIVLLSEPNRTITLSLRRKAVKSNERHLSI